MEYLLETMSSIQGQFPLECKQLFLLLLSLSTAGIHEFFLQFVGRLRIDTNPMEYYKNCLSLISYQNLQY